MGKNQKNNLVTVGGEIVSEFLFSHEVFGEKFYVMYVDIIRKSGEVDRLPVTVSERLVDVEESLVGFGVTVYGQYRSFNKNDGKKSYLILSVFAEEIEFLEDVDNCDNNMISLQGTICKEPIYRTTPKGREIADLLLAVNRDYGKSDYIPCICWGRNAKFAGSLKVGTKLSLVGRVQSRKYSKWIADDEVEERTAYEVSVKTLEVLPDEIRL